MDVVSYFVVTWKVVSGLVSESKVLMTKKKLALEVIERLRKEYPKGCRVELVSMDDFQAPPDGTKGTVVLVDDIGTVHVRWDNGSSLGAAYGIDEIRKVV